MLIIKKCLFPAIVLLLWGFTSFSQTPDGYTIKTKKAIALFEESEMFMVRRQYEQAIILLDEALLKNDNFVEAYARKAHIYGQMREQELSRANYAKVIELAPDSPYFSRAYYFLAEVALRRGEYGKAEELVDKFMSIQPIQRDLAPYAAIIKRNILYTRDNAENSLDFKPRPLPKEVNNIMMQYFPVLTADENTIIFTGRKGSTMQYDEDIYFCTKDENGKWSKPQSISDVINTQYNEGTCSISADGRTLIFTNCQGRRSYGGCDLFITQKVGDEWSKPMNLGPEVNSRFWESQPSLSADGRTLYFVSTRPTGLGKRDIYVTYQNVDRTWSRPKNLGTPINTEEDEVSPFIHANGQTLYFSSDGHPGFGSFDLYVTEMEQNAWQEPKNLGYPLNTFEEQVSLFVTADGKKGYYSNENPANKVGPISEIYEFEMPEEIQVKNKTNFVKGRIIDNETREYLQAKVDLINLDGNKLISTITSDNVSGEYLMVITEGSEYALYVNKKGYVFKSMRFDYLDQTDQESIVIDIYLDPIKSGSLTVLNNIFFDFDKYDLKEKSYPEMDKILVFLEENAEVNIGIAGHTDNEGNAAYNKELSLNRAKSVYQYLIDKGVATERLRYRGYGQEQPIAPNDSEENKQKNRRIEFVIL